MFEDEPDWFEHPAYAEALTDRERVGELLRLSPAARPAAVIASIDPRRLSAGERIDLIAMLAEQRNWLEAVEARVLARVDAADTTPQNLSQEAISLVLKVPLRTAQLKLKLGRTLVRELPRTLGLLDKGAISARHAEVIAESAWRLPPETVAAFEARLAERAADQSVPQLRRSARRAELALDPATAEQRHQFALSGRRVGLQPAEDGMVQLPVVLGASEGQLIFTRLTAAARLLPAQDSRTMDQRRADLLVDAVLAGLPHDALPELQGRRPSIQVVVSADTLLGADDEPGDLSGYGAITAQTARRLAADSSGSWRRLLTDPDTGQLLDLGAASYRPPQRLRDFVAARDGVCAFPTCNQPGYRCEYEHIVPFRQGGRTCRCNGALACRRHNQCKVDSGWSYERNADGSFTWTSDTGHRYRGFPPQRWARNAERREPDPPRRRTITEVRAAEDAAFLKLLNALNADLKRATAAADRRSIDRVQRAITSCELQRRRELENRVDPNVPPF